MKVRCPHCQVIYDIPSSSLEEAGHKVVCSECHNVFNITLSGSSRGRPSPRKPQASEKETGPDREMRDLLSDLERSLERRQAGPFSTATDATERSSGFLDDLPASPEEPSFPDTLPLEEADSAPLPDDPETFPDTQPLAEADSAPLPDDLEELPDTASLEDADTGSPPPEPPPDSINPEPFAAEPPGHRKGISAGTILLVLLLTLAAGGQLAWLQKDRLLQHPGVRSLAEKICPYLDCSLPPVEQAQTFRILDRLFEPYIPHPGAYRLNLLLRNDGTQAQPLPSLQLSLLDREQQVMARRTIAASTYRKQDMDRNGTVPPGQTLEVHLLLLPPRPDISGFELRLIPADT